MKNKEFDEESFSEKIKKRSGIAAIIGTGILGLLHISSHLIPAVGAIGYMKGYASSREEEIAIRLFGYNLNPVLSHPLMQIAYVAFIFLGFYYIYRDHKHHEHEKFLRYELYKAKRELEFYKNKKKANK